MQWGSNTGGMGEELPPCFGRVYERAGPLVKRACERVRLPPQLHHEINKVGKYAGLFYFHHDVLRGIEREGLGESLSQLRGSQAGIIGRHRGLAPCGSEAQEISPSAPSK